MRVSFNVPDSWADSVVSILQAITAINLQFEADNNTCEVDPSDGVEPVKRGRGRPRKHPLPGTAPAPEAPAPEAPAPEAPAPEPVPAQAPLAGSVDMVDTRNMISRIVAARGSEGAEFVKSTIKDLSGCTRLADTSPDQLHAIHAALSVMDENSATAELEY